MIYSVSGSGYGLSKVYCKFGCSVIAAGLRPKRKPAGLGPSPSLSYNYQMAGIFLLVALAAAVEDELETWTARKNKTVTAERYLW